MIAKKFEGWMEKKYKILGFEQLVEFHTMLSLEKSVRVPYANQKYNDFKNLHLSFLLFILCYDEGYFQGECEKIGRTGGEEFAFPSIVPLTIPPWTGSISRTPRKHRRGRS